MSDIDTSLPAGFESLQPHVARWAGTTAAERVEQRLQSTEAERLAFYAAARDLLPGALAHLDRKSLRHLDETEQRLMNLLLGLAHVALAVEVQADDEPVHALAAREMKDIRGSADYSPQRS